MDIVIDTVRITGFRGINNLEVSLNPRVTLLTGMNNSGKTSLLKALHIGLGNYSRYLSEEDFYVNADQERAEEILIDIKIVPAAPAEENRGKSLSFSDEWRMVFQDKIQTENDNQFVAIRTRCNQDAITGAFKLSRTILKKWPTYATWQEEKGTELKHKDFSFIKKNMQLISLEAQRDIHQELKEKTSFFRKILSNAKHNVTDNSKVQELLKTINNEITSNNNDLETLKEHLKKLNQTFQHASHIEITSAPKNIHDLFNQILIYFGDDEKNTFPMEYHGMGTRSWASVLTAIAFISLIKDRFEKEQTPFLFILAAEEPEAHLHPHAQKVLYHQLTQSKGQVIISTHSPYLAALAKLSELRHLKKTPEGIRAHSLSSFSDKDDDARKLHRTVIHSRGEVLFCRALILCEGETEEQALPLFFKKYFGDKDAFALGVSLVSIDGSGNYLPFLRLARDFSIPVFIFSDGEEQTVKNLQKQWNQVFKKEGDEKIKIEDCSNIVILDTDFESYLVSKEPGLIEETINELDDKAIANRRKQRPSASRTRTDEKCETCKQFIYEDKPSADDLHSILIGVLKSNKTQFAPRVAKKLCEKLQPENFPEKIRELFDKVKRSNSHRNYD